MENEKGKLNKTGSGGERNREVIGRTEKESVSKRETEKGEATQRNTEVYILFLHCGCDKYVMHLRHQTRQLEIVKIHEFEIAYDDVK